MELSARELRIGNYLEHYGNLAHVTWDVICDVEAGKGNYRPVPINEEWLEKFGFKKTPHYIELEFGLMSIDFNRLSNEFSLYVTNGEKFEDYEGTSIPIDIKYVHDLQNLYFALRGTELTRKD